jgi:acetyl-CoA synthetase
VKAGLGDKLALRWIGRDGSIRDFTYAALGAVVNRFSNVLTQSGIGKGERVFSLLGRVPELYIAALGTLKNGSVFSPLFSAFGPEPIKARRAIGDARAVITTEGFYRRKIEPWRKELASLKNVFCCILPAARPEGRRVPYTCTKPPLLTMSPAGWRSICIRTTSSGAPRIRDG